MDQRRRAMMRWLVPVCAGLALAALAGCAPQAGEGHPFGLRALTPHGLRGQFYTLPKGSARLPDFTRLSTKGTVFARQLNVAVANDVNGFDGLTDHNEWFALDYTTVMKTAQAGAYGFRLVSDDGSRLLIDGRPVIDNDGVHTPTSALGQASLAAGDHQLEVQYFKGPHYQVALQLYCTAPGGREALFPDCGGLTLTTPTRFSDHIWWLWLVGIGVVAVGWWLLRGRKSGS